jgi:hypothetical protein
VSFSDWERNAWVTAYKTSPKEVGDLLGLADRDLRDCAVKGLSDDWRLAIAYNAALQCATAALAAAGYRAARESHHFRIIQSLSLTIAADTGLVTKLDAFRKKRNIGDYERAGAISRAEADEMVAMAHDLRQRVEEWLKKKHRALLRK